MRSPSITREPLRALRVLVGAALLSAGGCYVPVQPGALGTDAGVPPVGDGGGGDADGDGGGTPMEGWVAPDLMDQPDLGGWLDPAWSDPAGTANLTAEGPLDWVHWGLYSENSLDHRAGSAPSITAQIIGTGPLHQYTDNHVVFSWSNGTPSSAATGTATGVFIEGVGNGFHVSVPAGPTVHTLNLYLSSFGADYRLTADLSDGSSPEYVDEQIYPVASNGLYRVYRFTYRSLTPNATLDVRWVDALDRYGGANVTLQAATLQ